MIRCDFCGKSVHEVKFMVEKSHSKPHLHICIDCVTLCVEVLAERLPKEEIKPIIFRLIGALR